MVGRHRAAKKAEETAAKIAKQAADALKTGLELLRGVADQRLREAQADSEAALRALMGSDGAVVRIESV